MPPDTLPTDGSDAAKVAGRSRRGEMVGGAGEACQE